MKFMTKLETIIMNRTGCNRETANLVANDILYEVDNQNYTERSYLDILNELKTTLDSDAIPKKDKEEIDTVLQHLFELLFPYSY